MILASEILNNEVLFLYLQSSALAQTNYYIGPHRLEEGSSFCLI